MATATGLTLIKEFPYRGDATEQFSNKYWFKGQPPGDSASWLVLADDVWMHERTLFPTTVKLVHAYGYDNTDANANHVWSYDYAAAGTPPPGTLAPPVGGHLMAGDQAALVEWKTDALSTRGKMIYLRKYFHS